jgi:FKBP-type peptidyl-prolyl cis-trans isomerase
MKRLAIIALAIALALPVAAQTQAPAADASYALGMLMAGSVKGSGLDVDLDSFMAGFQDALRGSATRLTSEQAQTLVQAAVGAAQTKKAGDNLAAGQAFLAQNRGKAGIKETASGLQYEVLSLGTGPMPAASDTVTVNYEGRLLDGTVFDSSIARGEPATFALGQVIHGWTEGLQLMPVGSKFRLYIPSDLAYGARGAGNLIGPNATLIFDVELLSIDKQ